MSSRLTPEQVAHYACDGYTLFHQPVFAPEKFARLKEIFEENLARYGEDDLDIMHCRDARLLEFLLADEVLDLIEPLGWPEYRFVEQSFHFQARRNRQSDALARRFILLERQNHHDGRHLHALAGN